MRMFLRRVLPALLVVGAGVAVLATGGFTSASSAAPSGAVAVAADVPPLATCNGPTVNADRTVTFCLTAPQATSVALNWQNMVGRSPAAEAKPMTKQDNGIWVITIGPLDPNLYGYGFTVDSANIADPANRDIWSGPTSAWSNVFVPGPASDYIADAAVPHGAVSTVRYYSKLTQSERQMQVYTPPGYGHGNRDYPVLYILHGAGGNDTDWVVNMRANFILDNLIAQGKAAPMIVVSPDTSVGANPTGVTDDLFEKELMDTIIPYTEHNYRTARGPQNRALAGLSRGSNHSRNIMFLDPNEFAYYGFFSSGAMNPTAMADVMNHPDLITNVAKSKVIRRVWISEGGLEATAFPDVEANLKATLAFFDQHGIKYQYVDGPSIGAVYGHVWDTWRKHLLAFAPILFRHGGDGHHR